MIAGKAHAVLTIIFERIRLKAFAVEAFKLGDNVHGVALAEARDELGRQQMRLLGELGT